MYGIAVSNIVGVKKIPIDFVENVMEENQMPDYRFAKLFVKVI
jgi:hypothetical protein